MIKKRVLHIVTNVYDGGLEKVVYLIIKNTDRNKIENHIAVLAEQDQSFLLDKILKEDVKNIKLNFQNRFTGNFKSILHNLSQIRKLSEYVKDNRIDILHSHDFFPAFITRLTYLYTILFKFYKVKRIIITLHNLFYWLNNFHHFINRILGHFTYKIVCVSNAVKNYSMTKDKIKKDKYMVIYNGVELNHFVPDKAMKKIYLNEFNLNQDFTIIGNIGVLSERKGQKYLINAFNNIYKSKKDLYLIIFGSEREHEKPIAKEIYDLLNDYGLNDAVRIIQPRQDINKIYNLFDVFVMPSITEGMSLCLIESMLMKNIGLYSDIEPFTEFVNDNKNGFLFKSENVNDLTIKLANILNNIDKLNHIGNNARNYITENFSDVKMAKSYEILYLN